MKLKHILENRMRDRMKYGPDITLEQEPRSGGRGGNWMAYDRNTYDGAPDAGPGSQAMGHGVTKNAAVIDLVDQLEELGLYSPESLEQAMQELFPGPSV